MAKARPSAEVLILGSHPCAFMAAMLLKSASIDVELASLPHHLPTDRLVLINPEFFKLNEIAASIQPMLDLTPYHGLAFLGTRAASTGCYDQPSPVAYACNYASVQNAFKAKLDEAQIAIASPERIEVVSLDEKGVEVQLGDQRIHPKLILAADPLPEEMRKALGVAMSWDMDVLKTYVFLRTKSAALTDKNRRLMLSLELEDAEQWGWAFMHQDELQLSITTSPHANEAQMRKAMQQWITILSQQKAITSDAVDVAKLSHVHLPFGGALTQEDVGNRTLLFGPAGGFYSASGEDIYPNCWSAVFAADVAKKAVKDKHLQDGLQAYRHRWGSTLGDFLRGPQQNLKFLLPLVYRNPVMCARLAESILTGASVVR